MCTANICLKTLVTPQNQPAHSDITCPQCRHVTPIPNGGVASLPHAFHLRDLLDIIRDDGSSPKPASPVGAALTSAKKVRYCLEHDLEVLKYCEACDELICNRCVEMGSRHHHHAHLGLNEALEEYKKVISSSLEPMKEQIVTIEKALAQLSVCNKEITDQRVMINRSPLASSRRFSIL